MTAEPEAAPDPLLATAGLSQRDLADLLALVSDSDLVEVDVRFGEGSLVRLRRDGRRPVPAAAPDPPDAAQPSAEPSPLAITSPLVGVFHPSVLVGEAVQAGQPIGAIEALGLPTQVDAPREGVVEEVLVPEGSPVEYGQTLLLLRRAAPS